MKNTIKNMMMYYFELLDDHYNDLGATIPDGAVKVKPFVTRKGGRRSIVLNMPSCPITVRQPPPFST